MGTSSKTQPSRQRNRKASARSAHPQRRAPQAYIRVGGDDEAGEGFVCHSWVAVVEVLVPFEILRLGLSPRSGWRLRRHLLGALRRLFNRTDVHKRLVGEVVPFSGAEFAEGADGVFAGAVDALEAGELLGDVERLR